MLTNELRCKDTECERGRADAMAVIEIITISVILKGLFNCILFSRAQVEVFKYSVQPRSHVALPVSLISE